MESYQKLESYLGLAAKTDSYSHYGFEKSESGVFQPACFFPGACLLAKRHCKHVIVLDGTHLKGDMNKRGVYLLAASKDYNNRILGFGLALVEKEDTSNWRWFLKLMKAAVASASSDWDLIFVTDRQTGILATIKELYPYRGHRFCVRHNISNSEKMSSRLAPQEQALIFAMARIECENDCKFYRSQLGDTRPLAAQSLDTIEKAHWVTYAFNEEYNQSSYDEVTSNLSEAANNWLGNDCRSSFPLLAFEQFMIKVVELFAERRREAFRGYRSSKRSGMDSPTDQSSRDNDVPVETNTHIPEILVPAYQEKLDTILT
ncbi:hypothetical protein PC120_g140 [Phytophthora cactorum]|nr:hypothetical protein PC120_g140 [Phytophthora cactorum]